MLLGEELLSFLDYSNRELVGFAKPNALKALLSGDTLRSSRQELRKVLPTPVKNCGMTPRLRAYPSWVCCMTTLEALHLAPRVVHGVAFIIINS